MCYAASGAFGAEAPFAGVQSWGYQLQHLNPSIASKSPFDLLVVEYREAAAHVAKLKVKPDGSRRRVVSYISIGEAEDYRPYWKAGADWAGPENPEWKGNYSARFWLPSWRQIMFNYIDQIAAAGFDGIYLDKVDVFHDWAKGTRPDMKADMVAFMLAINNYAHSKGLSVILQNAEEMLAIPAVLASIDGVARESLFYGEDSPGKPNNPSSVKEVIDFLNRANAAGKPVFFVEYLPAASNASKAVAARERGRALGFIPYIGNRELTRLFF